MIFLDFLNLTTPKTCGNYTKSLRELHQKLAGTTPKVCGTTPKICGLPAWVRPRAESLENHDETRRRYVSGWIALNFLTCASVNGIALYFARGCVLTPLCAVCPVGISLSDTTARKTPNFALYRQSPAAGERATRESPP